MKILQLIQRTIPKSVSFQMQAVEVEHQEVFTERELTPLEVKKVNQHQMWATKQLKKFYEERNPAVKEAKQ